MKHQTEVLIVGAGPTGLLAANLLADAGIEVQLIDREERTATRSYACALHTRSLKLLSELGLAEAALRQGRRISAMAFYDGEVRCAEARFSELDEEFPFLLVLPQSALEDLLEQRLRKKAGASLHWNHRFDGFEAEEHALVANVEKLGGTAVGYIVPHWETVVEKRFAVRTQFVIGADGHNSLVRHRAGIEYQRLHEPQSFVACEFTCDSGERDELRVVLDQGTTNVLWPLPGDEFRWTFQLIHSEVSGEFPEKQRRQTSAAEPLLNERIRAGIQRLAKQRAPWFVSKVNEINWCSQVVFQQGLAREFGRGRCWLAGDAGHQTGPVGVQSMNAGLGEAQELATCLYSILRERAPMATLAAYDAQRRQEWRALLGLEGGLKARPSAGEWVRRRAGRILPCLAASGPDLADLADQLGLDPCPTTGTAEAQPQLAGAK